MLSRFNNWFKERYNPILEGVFGSWNYHFPEDKKQQMYDFYMLEYLLPPGIHMHLRPSDFGGEDVDAADQEMKQKGSPSDDRHAGDMSRTTEDKFSYALYEVANKLLPKLKKELLEAVLFSIAAELRHVFDYHGNKPKNIVDKVKKELGPKEAKLLRDYAIAQKGLQNSDVADLLTDRHPVPHSAAGSNGDYQTSYRAMRRAGGTDEEWAKLASWLFSNVEWNGSYGGPAWAGIADGWLHLNAAKNPTQIMTYIDHIYDLQHNTGSVFTKLKSYQNGTGGFSWIKDALDHKRDLVSPHEMLEHLSPSMRELAKIGITLKTGKTWHDFVKEWPEVLKKKTDIYNQMAQAKFDREKEAYEKNHPGQPYYDSPPRKVTPEEYASSKISDKKIKSPVDADQYISPLYSVGKINKDYQDTKVKNPDGSSGLHPKEFDVGDKVEIIGGYSPYVGHQGAIVDKIMKGELPYFTVTFTSGKSHDFKANKLKIIEKNIHNKNKINNGDTVLIKSGEYKNQYGTVDTQSHTSGIYSVKLPSKKDSLMYSPSAIEKVDLPDPEVGDYAEILAGSHKGQKGIIMSKAQGTLHDIYKVNLLVSYGHDLFNFPKLELKILKKASGSSPNAGGFKVGDKVKILYGHYNKEIGKVKTVNSDDTYDVEVFDDLSGPQNVKYYKDKLELAPDEFAGPNTIKVGDEVEILSGSAHKGKTGTVEKINSNGTYDVSFDSGEGLNSYYKNELVKLPPKKEQFKVDDEVEVLSGTYKGKTGKIEKVNPNYTYDVSLPSDVTGETVLTYHHDNLKLVPKISAAFKLGDKVSITAGGGQGKTGTIDKINPNGTYSVELTDDIGTASLKYSKEELKLVPQDDKGGFKVGDKVKVTSGGQLYLGKTGVIDKVVPGGYDVISDNDEDKWWHPFQSHELELISYKLPTFKYGDNVDVIDGPYKGSKGVIEKKMGTGILYQVHLNHTWVAIPAKDLKLSEKHSIKVGDFVKIVKDSNLGKIGKVSYIPVNSHYYTVDLISGPINSYTLDNIDLATPEEVEAEKAKLSMTNKNYNKPIKDMQMMYDGLQPFLFPQELKVARTLIYALHFNNTNFSSDDILGKVNTALETNYTMSQLQDIKKIYEKEVLMHDYFDKHVMPLPHPITQQAAHDIIVQNFHDVPAKPFLDKATVMKLDDLIESNQRLAAIKLIRQALGWPIRAAKSYMEYMMLELIMNGVAITGNTPAATPPWHGIPNPLDNPNPWSGEEETMAVDDKII